VALNNTKYIIAAGTIIVHLSCTPNRVMMMRGEEIDIADEENNLIEELPPPQPKLYVSVSEPLSTVESTDKPPVRYRSVSESNATDNKSETPQNSNYISTLMEMIPRPLMRRVSSTNSSTSVPVFNCSICLENHPLSEAFSVGSCVCKHQFCKPSMQCYLTSQISEGIITHKCPNFDACSGRFEPWEIKSLVSDETFQKYTRFKEMKENPNVRECPHCATSVIGSKDDPEITCAQCGAKYCYHHANAHPDMSCRLYTISQSRQEMQAKNLISNITMKCPSCHVDTEKSGGCNHMTCQHCREVSLPI
jgi:hypothetical protein